VQQKIIRLNARLNKRNISGVDIHAIIEARDTYLVINTTANQMPIATTESLTSNASNTPTDVATPLPPLNFKNIGQM